MNDPTSSYYQAAWSEYLSNRTGAFTMAHGNSIAFASLNHLTTPTIANSTIAAIAGQTAQDFLPHVYGENPELLAGFLAQREQLVNNLPKADAGAMEMAIGGTAGTFFAIQKPLSRGSIQITSLDPDPAVTPFLDLGTFLNPIDVNIAVLCMKMIRRLYASASLAVRQPRELAPTASAQTDDEIAATMRGSALGSFQHQCGTASMLPLNKGGVVDPSLRVYGVTGLRVVDASIIPLIPACHLQSTVYAIAEKAADIILGV